MVGWGYILKYFLKMSITDKLYWPISLTENIVILNLMQMSQNIFEILNLGGTSDGK